MDESSKPDIVDQRALEPLDLAVLYSKMHSFCGKESETLCQATEQINGFSASCTPDYEIERMIVRVKKRTRMKVVGFMVFFEQIQNVTV